MDNYRKLEKVGEGKLWAEPVVGSNCSEFPTLAPTYQISTTQPRRTQPISSAEADALNDGSGLMQAPMEW